jgi:NitT/TauT family transport system substrate-binding protein
MFFHTSDYLPRLTTVAAVCLALTSCAETPTTPSGALTVETAPTTALTTPSDPVALRPVAIGLPYRPDVQFAPFYVALQQGYYAAEGLDVELRYGDESDFIRLVAAGELDMTVASGEQVILAAGADIPVKYVGTWYHRFPVAVVSLEPLEEPAQLVDRLIGLPAASGASATGLRALLHGAGMDAMAVRTQIIGFEQAAALEAGRVGAAVGYIANEPLQLKARGHDVWTLEVADYFDLVANGLVVASTAIDTDAELVQALVSATLRGIADTLDDPDLAFEMVLRAVPEAGADDETRTVQRAVLDESIRLWQPPRGREVGHIEPEAWDASRSFMLDTADPPIGHVPPVEELIDSRFVEHYSRGN